jgi:hypothetical protein
VPELALPEAELARISMPVCSVVGSRDPLRLSAEALAGRVADHTLVYIEGADHIQAPMHAEMLDALLECLHR